MIVVTKLVFLSADFRVIKAPAGPDMSLCLHAVHAMADTSSGLQDFWPFQSYYLEHTFMLKTSLSSIGYICFSPVAKNALFSTFALKAPNFVSMPVMLEFDRTEASEKQHFYRLINSLSY